MIIGNGSQLTIDLLHNSALHGHLEATARDVFVRIRQDRRERQGHRVQVCLDQPDQLDSIQRNGPIPTPTERGLLITSTCSETPCVNRPGTLRDVQRTPRGSTGPEGHKKQAEPHRHLLRDTLPLIEAPSTPA